ncbi:MAG: hypothetical protein A2X59_00135 [Nitrospirae bacterium GWC2_42_7]|nr:MAG: hypothetical protein A2X59_00135 [Nitrospirae bacterium GWC2_42_7]
MKEVKVTEFSKEFADMIKEMQGLEDETIRYSEDMNRKTNNPLIRMTMDIIRHDSEKHKVMQQMILDSLSKESLHLMPEELAVLSSVLEKHIDAEAKSIELAEKALDNSEMFSTKYILSMLISDEKKHHGVLGQLSELKKATVFVT